jgi:hypothetical protein
MFRSVILMMATVLLLPAPVAGGLFPRVHSVSDQWAGRELARFQEEEYMNPEFMHLEIRLLESCDNNADSCVFDLSAPLYSGCGSFYKETNLFCVDPLFGNVCCGDDSSDCCEPNVGVMVGVGIGIFAFFTMLICGCCYCCKCCCLVSTTILQLLDPDSLNFCRFNIAFVPSYIF